MTALLAETAGKLTIATSDHRLDELAFRTAAEIVENGERLIVVDAAGFFDPLRMTHSARTGTIDPAGLMKHLLILRARSAPELENLIVNHLENAFERMGTRNVLIPGLLSALYESTISTRDAARILGRVKSKLEELAETGARIVLLCGKSAPGLGTRSHFLSSLRASADRVYCRSNT